MLHNMSELYQVIEKGPNLILGNYDHFIEEMAFI
jgi:hypothetical protein